MKEIPTLHRGTNRGRSRAQRGGLGGWRDARACRASRPHRGEQRPDANLFQTTAGAPLPRRYFNTVLRRRLDRAQARFPAGVRFDLARFSGISFRKGCLSTLGALNVPEHWHMT